MADPIMTAGEGCLYLTDEYQHVCKLAYGKCSLAVVLQPHWHYIITRTQICTCCFVLLCLS